jgi:nucleolar protein 4
MNRDLPFDATSSDLKRAFGKFGHIDLAIIVKDKVTGVSKGSAFVKFVSPSAAQDCVRYADSGSAAGTGGSAGGSTGCTGGIVVRDRPCRVDLAVDRDQAEKLKLDNKKALAKVRGSYTQTYIM